MSDDEIEYARALVEATTPGPWTLRLNAQAQGYRGACECEWHVDAGRPPRPIAIVEDEAADGYVAEDDARAIALLGSTAREALAVIEAVDARLIKRIPGADRCRVCGQTSPFRVFHDEGCPGHALDAWRASVREHERRERGGE